MMVKHPRRRRGREGGWCLLMIVKHPRRRRGREWGN